MDDQKNAMGPALGGEVVGGQSSKGPTIGAVIVVIILIIGALYIFWQKNVIEPTAGPLPDEAETMMDGTDLMIDNLDNQSTSDEIGALEVDAAATDLSNLDRDLELGGDLDVEMMSE